MGSVADKDEDTKELQRQGAIMVKITDSYLHAFSTNSRVELKDELCPGLWMRVGSGGTKTWILRIKVSGKQRSITLGHFPAMSLKQARIAASSPEDVLGNKYSPPAKPLTIEDVVNEYMETSAVAAMRRKDNKEWVLRKKVIAKIGGIAIKDLTRKEVRDVVEDIKKTGKNATAYRVITEIKSLLNYAVEVGHIPFSPLAGMKPNVGVSTRDRYLTKQEIRDLWLFLSDDRLHFGTRKALQVLIATGQRRNEITNLHSREINNKECIVTFPVERVKNKTSHILPVTQWHLDLIGNNPNDGGYMFPGSSQMRPISPTTVTNLIANYCKIRGITPTFTVHDFRRTFLTYLAEMRVSRDDAKRCVNHTFGDVTSRHYDKFLYMDEKRAVMEKWRDFLIDLTS